MLAGACATCGVALLARVADADKAAAYRPALVGMTTFVLYYLVHPHVGPAVPQLHGLAEQVVADVQQGRGHAGRPGRLGDQPVVLQHVQRRGLHREVTGQQLGRLHP